MRYTICEKLMWAAMTSAIFDYISSKFPNVNIKQKKKTEHHEDLIPYMCEML